MSLNEVQPPAGAEPPLGVAEDSSRGTIRRTLGLLDVVTIIVGIVIGSGIFKLPGLVAGSCSTETTFLLVWLAGGVMSLIGALCYAELASTYPNAGGDYSFIHRAFGRPMSFLFAWSRMTVIQTGSIAFLGFFIGDYLSALYPLGPYSPAVYAALTIVSLTALNLLGIRQGKWAQIGFTSAIVAGLLMVVGFGLAGTPAETDGASHRPSMGLGMAMVFVLLSFGGWNESAYVSAEIKRPEKNIVRSLILGLTCVTIVYVLVNLAYLRVLGLAGMAESRNVAQDLIRVTMGERFVPVITFCVVFAVLSSANATIISGARSNYALGRDFKVFRWLGVWNSGTSTPAAALIVQGLISLALVWLGVAIHVESGFETMVAYTTPVFWFFFFLVGVALFVLRRKDPDRRRVFSVPFYPVTPLLFCLIGLYMLKNGFDYILLLPKIGLYSGVGAAIGVAVLLLGVPFWLIDRRLSKAQE